MRLAALLAALACGCGGGSVCGNGKAESGEQCDDGNLLDGDGCSSSCIYVKTIDTFVHFKFISVEYAAQGYEGESCAGLGIAEVEVTAAGPTTRSERVPCSFSQVKISALPPGTYTATARALDAGGQPVSRGLAQVGFTVEDRNQDVQLDFPFADFDRAYSGNFLFNISWAGAVTCAGATPPVVKQRVLLERAGAALPGRTDAGDAIDGSAGSCRDVDNTNSQRVNGLAWGPARITLTGEDGGGRATFRKSFDTFVGAGNNPSLTFDVPSILPDAGPADAGLPDGAP